MSSFWKTATSNAFNTTLNGTIGVSDSSITLTSVTGLQSPGILVIDRQDINGTNTPTLREYVSYTNIASNTVTGVTRAVSNSTAQSHASGAKVEEVFSTLHWSDLLTLLLNVFTAAGIVDTTKVVDLTTSQTLTNKILTLPTITKPVMSATNPTAQTYSPAGGGTATLDLSLSNQHLITMPAGNATIALSNDTNNQPFVVSITQDSVGSRTVTWFTTIKWAGGSAPTLTTTASKRDTLGFLRTGTGTYDGFVIGQNL